MDASHTGLIATVVALASAVRREDVAPAPNVDGRNTMGAYPGDDSMRLLRAINAQQTHGRVGSIVFPFAVARSARLRPGTERYEEALWGLVWEGPLAVNGCVSLEAAARLPFGRAPYRLAPTAMRLLEVAKNSIHPSAWKGNSANPVRKESLEPNEASNEPWALRAQRFPSGGVARRCR